MFSTLPLKSLTFGLVAPKALAPVPFGAVVASVVSLSSRSQVKRAASVEFQGKLADRAVHPSRW